MIRYLYLNGRSDHMAGDCKLYVISDIALICTHNIVLFIGPIHSNLGLRHTVFCNTILNNCVDIFYVCCFNIIYRKIESFIADIRE